MKTKQKAVINSGLFKFLKDLKDNNNREWFTANKGVYEEKVRDPLLEFIVDFSEPLSRISTHYIALPTAQGGSLFRIYRDTRFGKDKRPYKENAGVHFRHEAGKDAHAPGFYLHLEPGNCFAASGIWHPENVTLNLIRDAIVENPKEWKKITQGKRFVDSFGSLMGESLKRPPKGYDPEHELMEDLKRKDFIVGKKISQKEVCAVDFVKQYARVCQEAKAFAKFLTEAIGLLW
ncbi:MAG: DUF2461 domain-containing protein [Planctomycetes bacterium]|nr:DUF2461 domain-containing protein [Planctomycetota bacterium]